MSVMPSIGLINKTNFIIQARENSFYSTNSYEFYYFQKGISSAPRIDIPNTKNSRQIPFIFQDPKINATLVSSVTYVVFADVYVQGAKVTVSDEVTLYTSLDEFIKVANSTLAVTPDILIQNAIPQISSTMSSSDALTTATLISTLTTDITGNTQTLNATITNNQAAIQASNKPVVSVNGTVALPPPVLCNDEFCNYKGYCYMLNRVTRSCKCLPKFRGSNCQISQDTKKKFDELASNLTSSLLVKLNTTNPDSSNKPVTVNSDNFQTINTLATSVSLMSPSSANIKDLTLTISLSMKNFNNPDNAREIAKNSALIISTINTLLTALVQVTENTKYANLEKDYQQGKVDSTKITVTPIDFTKDQVTGFSSTNTQSTGNAANTPTTATGNTVNTPTTATGNTSNTPTTATGNKPNTRRTLQIASNTDNNNFIISPSSDYVMTLTADQTTELRSNYLSILTTTNNLNLALIIAAQKNAFDYSGSTNYFDYIISSIQNVNTYSFQTYFASRIANKQSYFDASDCLKSFVSANSSNQAYDFSTIYFIYYYFTYPIYSYDTNLSSSALSLTHSFKFYDADGDEIPITSCTNDIVHNLPIFPNNKDFITKLNFYPQKYYDGPQYNLGKNFMPFYIFMNGTIDNNNPIALQKDMYYRQYQVNLNSYDSTQYTFSTPANNKFKYLNSNGDSISTSKSTGEFTLFATGDPLTTQLSNTYYMNYNQIFNIGENYRGNPSWYTVILQLGFFLIALVLTIVLKNIFRKFSNNNSWFEYENSQLLKDSQVFGDNRFVFFDENHNINLISVNSEEHFDSQGQHVKKESGQANFANNKLARNKNAEDLKDNEENKGEAGRIQVNNFEIDGQANAEAKDDQDGNKIKLNMNGNKSDEASESNKNSNKLGYGKVMNSSKNKVEYDTNKKIYNIFYFIGLRNIYSNLVLLSSPFSPKYKNLSKFALFVWLHMLITSLLLVFAPFTFNVS